MSKISQYPSTTPTASDSIPVVQSGVTKKVTVSSIALGPLADTVDVNNGDALLGVKRINVTGALATTQHVANENRAINLVTEFGGNGDGVTSNNAAFTLAEAGAAVIYVPEGTYVCTLGSLTKVYYGPGNIKLNGTLIGPNNGWYRGSQGAQQRYANSAGADFLEFSATGANIKATVGALSGEANLAFNMDYTTGVHRFYDASANAVWQAMNIAG